MLGSPLLKAFVWSIGAVALVSNLFVLVCRLGRNSVVHKNPANIVLLSLASSDMLMPFYLLCLGSADMYLKGKFFLHANTWKSTFGCHILSCLGLFSFEMSISTGAILIFIYQIILKLSKGQISQLYSRITAVCIVNWAIFLVFCLALTLVSTEQANMSFLLFSSRLRVDMSIMYAWFFFACVEQFDGDCNVHYMPKADMDDPSIC